jgi:hypothetical protein
MSSEFGQAYYDTRCGGVSDERFLLNWKRIDNSWRRTRIFGRCPMRIVRGADIESAAIVARFLFPSRRVASAAQGRSPDWSIFGSE